jgi:hypothetical protein
MGSLWSFLSASKNQKTISWLGGGLAVVIAGLWAAFVYFNSPKADTGGSAGNCNITSGGIASGGNKVNCDFSPPTAPTKP